MKNINTFIIQLLDLYRKGIANIFDGNLIMHEFGIFVFRTDDKFFEMKHIKTITCLLLNRFCKGIEEVLTYDGMADGNPSMQRSTRQ